MGRGQGWTLLVEGRIGTGVSTLLRTLVRHALEHPEGWEAVVVIRATLFGEGVRSALRASARDDAEAGAVMGNLVDLAEARMDALEDLGIRNISGFDVLDAERPRRIMVVVEDPASYPERVISRLGRFVRLGSASGVHVVGVGGRTVLLPAAIRDGFKARAEMLTGRVSFSELGGDPAWGFVRNTGARELDEIVCRVAGEGLRAAA